jgi:tRNA pseudouridine38-40 synthase
LSARLRLEYDGSRFAGWAVQPGRRTVQAELEDVLGAARGEPVPLSVAGRTDAGVHARGQVASHAGAPVPAARLNAMLPDDVRVLSSEPAPEGFDARRDARSRTYRYRVFTRSVPSVFERRQALHWPHRLDLDVLRSCAERLQGTHDFTAFTPTETEHVHFHRTVLRATWIEAGADTLELWIEADAFLRRMVRVLVGTMLLVAGERSVLDEAAFARLLAGRPRAAAGDTAAPHGLYLESVRY